MALNLELPLIPQLHQMTYAQIIAAAGQVLAVDSLRHRPDFWIGKGAFDLQIQEEEYRLMFAHHRDQGQTNENFYREMVENPVKFAQRLRPAKTQHDRTHGTLLSALNTLSGDIRKIQTEVHLDNIRKDAAPYADVAAEFRRKLDSFLGSCNVLLSEVEDVRAPYGKYLEKLDALTKRLQQHRLQTPAQTRRPQVMMFQGMIDGPAPFIGSYFGYLGEADLVKFPLTVNAYRTLLIQNYKDYLVALDKTNDRAKVEPYEHFCVSVNQTLQPLQEGDILDTDGYRGIGYLYVYEKDGHLYLTPTKGEYGYYLPKEGFKMLREANIQNRDELVEHYAQELDILGFELPVDTDEYDTDEVTVDFVWRHEPEAENTQVYINGYPIQIKTDSFDYLPEDLREDLLRKEPRQARPKKVRQPKPVKLTIQPTGITVPVVLGKILTDVPVVQTTVFAPPKDKTPVLNMILGAVTQGVIKVDKAEVPVVQPASPQASPNTGKYANMKGDQLKKLLRERKLRVVGNKAEMIQRLEKDDNKNTQ